MNYQAIHVTLKDNIATITLNRPDVMNALNTAMRAELTQATREMSQKARVIVFTGEGSAFCSGQDLGSGQSLNNFDVERALRDEYEPMLSAIINCPVPTVTALNGVAAGAGANLALAADVVIAKHSAYFVQAFSKIGLMPDAGGTYILPRTIGLAKAMGTAFFADKITGEEADKMGLIYESVPDDKFDDHINKRVHHLATGPSIAFSGIKEAMRASSDNNLAAQLELEAKLQKACGKSRDFKEGALSFLEKRAPKFEGR